MNVECLCMRAALTAARVRLKKLDYIERMIQDTKELPCSKGGSVEERRKGRSKGSL